MADVRLDRQQMLDRVPHGEEVFELDYVDVEKDSCRAVTIYPESNPILKDHFGLVPGTRLLEAALQSSMFVPGDESILSEGIAIEVGCTRFRRPVKGGDTISFHTLRVEANSLFCEYETKAYNQEDKLVLTCKFKCR